MSACAANVHQALVSVPGSSVAGRPGCEERPALKVTTVQDSRAACDNVKMFSGPGALDRHRAAVRARLINAGAVRPDPVTVTWRVNREIIVVAGWGRAILLQLAHPLIAAGVADHSS